MMDDFGQIEREKKQRKGRIVMIDDFGNNRQSGHEGADDDKVSVGKIRSREKSRKSTKDGKTVQQYFEKNAHVLPLIGRLSTLP